MRSREESFNSNTFREREREGERERERGRGREKVRERLWLQRTLRSSTCVAEKEGANFLIDICLQCHDRIEAPAATKRERFGKRRKLKKVGVFLCRRRRRRCYRVESNEEERKWSKFFWADSYLWLCREGKQTNVITLSLINRNLWDKLLHQILGSKQKEPPWPYSGSK